MVIRKLDAVARLMGNTGAIRNLEDVKQVLQRLQRGLESVVEIEEVEETTPSGGTPDPHATTHENGGPDEIDVTGLSGLLADPQTPDAHVHSIAEIVDYPGSADEALLYMSL